MTNAVAIPDNQIILDRGSRPCSNFGQSVGPWTKGRGQFFIALESYFDGSKDGGRWENSRYITLAAFAADDSIWAQFNDGWQVTLDDDHQRPKAAYCHMRELKDPDSNEFNWRLGWNKHKSGLFVGELMMYMQKMDKQRFHMFAVTLDMEAYKRVKEEGVFLSEPSCIVADLSAFMVLAWYTTYYPGIICDAHYFFDADEPFEEIVKNRWNAERNNILDITAMRESWQVIKTVASKEMKKTPGLQAADLLAWASNRNLVADEGEFGKYYQNFLKEIVACHWLFVDEERLRDGGWRPKGLVYKR